MIKTDHFIDYYYTGSLINEFLVNARKTNPEDSVFQQVLSRGISETLIISWDLNVTYSIIYSICWKPNKELAEPLDSMEHWLKNTLQ